MEIKIATQDDLEKIFLLIDDVIKTIFPKYYSKAIIDAFSEYHSLDTIKEDIEANRVYVMKDDYSNVIATGSVEDNYIKRIFVDRSLHKKGYGKKMVEFFEEMLRGKFDKITLDSNYFSSGFYDSLGYTFIKHDIYPVEGDVINYDVYEKKL